MKNKSSRFGKILFPALIVLQAHAATILPDSTGNITIAAATNEASTILANGGTNPAPVVTIEAGAVLTGDAVLQTGAEFSSPGYTLNNSGSLAATLEGVFVEMAAASTTIINNNFGGLIEGGNDGIYLDADGGVITNSGIIRGVVGAGSDGIEGFSDLVVTNFGSISGLSTGIFAEDRLDLINETGATISGTAAGVSTGAFAIIDNFGLISSTGGDGISLGTSGDLLNSGTIEGVTGIVALDGSIVTNSGIIRSTAIGGNAFSGGAGDDQLFLNAGSLIEGNVLGGGGNNSIVFNGGLTSPTSPVNNIRGSVTDFTTITKEGGGVALIGAVADVGGGLNITADTIAITGGGLYFNADITGATIAKTNINAGGAAVGGTGIWNANLNLIAGGISAGAIPINLDAIPSNAVGAVAITGDVVHSPGSFVRMDFVPDTPIIDGINSDIIEQIGAGNTYNLTGANLRLSSTDVNRLITPGSYIIIDSDEAIIGDFGATGVQFNANIIDNGPFFATGSGANALDTVLTNHFVTRSFTDGGSNLVLDVSYDFANLPGLSTNQSALGGALDNLALQAGSGMLGAVEQDFISALSLSNLPAVQASLASLVPDGSLSLVSGVVNSNYRLHRMVQNHLARARSGQTREAPMAPTMDAKGGMVQAPSNTVSASRGSFWGTLSYDWQDYEGSGRGNDFDGETGAFTAGYDYRVSPMFLIGGLLDGSVSDYDYRGGSSDVDSFRVAVYGTYGEALGFYSDFLLGYGSHDLEQKRSLGGIGGLGGSSRFSTDADSLQAMLTAGYSMGDQRMKHGPFAGLEYQKVDADGFSQSGGPFAITVGDYDIDSLRALVGYRVDADLGTFKPYASIAYAHEFEDGSNSTTANFGGAGGNFRISGAELGSAVLLSAGAGMALSPNLDLDFGYRGEISVENEGLTSHGVSVGLNYQF